MCDAGPVSRRLIERANAKRRAWSAGRARARNLRPIGVVGHGSAIHGRCTITGADRIELGSNVHIGEGSFIRAEAGLRIGDNTHISRNLLLYTMNHEFEGTALPYDHTMRYRPVEIGRNVWIGMNVCIAPGTVIGDGAIVAMGATISGTVPARSIVASQPWRIIGTRDDEHYDALEREQRYGASGGHPYVPPS